MFFAGNDFFGYPSYRAQPSRRQFNYSPSYSFYDDHSDDEDDQGYFSHNYRPQTARSQRYQQELLQKQQEQVRAKQLREQAEQLKRQQEQQALIKKLQQQKELEEKQRKNAEQAQKLAQNKRKEEDAKLKEDIALANIEKNLEALSTDESDDNSNENEKNTDFIIEDVKMNYWEMLGVSAQKNTLKEGFIDENYPESVESQAKQLSALLKKDLNECLRIANTNRDCSIGQLIDIALNGSASF